MSHHNNFSDMQVVFAISFLLISSTSSQIVIRITDIAELQASQVIDLHWRQLFLMTSLDYFELCIVNARLPLIICKKYLYVNFLLSSKLLQHQTICKSSNNRQTVTRFSPEKSFLIRGIPHTQNIPSKFQVSPISGLK